MVENTTNEQAGTRKLLRNPVVERDGGALCQLNENQWQTMDVSLNQNDTTTATKQRTETQLTTNSVESCMLWDIKLNEQMCCCQLRQWGILRTPLLTSVISMSIATESWETETSIAP